MATGFSWTPRGTPEGSSARVRTQHSSALSDRNICSRRRRIRDGSLPGLIRDGAALPADFSSRVRNAQPHLRPAFFGAGLLLVIPNAAETDAAGSLDRDDQESEEVPIRVIASVETGKTKSRENAW